MTRAATLASRVLSDSARSEAEKTSTRIASRLAVTGGSRIGGKIGVFGRYNASDQADSLLLPVGPRLPGGRFPPRRKSSKYRATEGARHATGVSDVRRRQHPGHRAESPMTQAQRTDWLPLPLHDWHQTQTALHLRAQIVGKTRLALAPMQNHWWQVAQYVTARGLSTSPMPYGDRTLEIEFDFMAHTLVFRTAEGEIRTLPLVPQSIADFYHDYQALLRSLEIDVHIWPLPQEMAEAIRFTDDRAHAAYDRDAVERFFKVLVQVDRVLKSFRSRFMGKSSPSHFWWGGFDMACTRFSGRPATTHPGGIPHLADFVTREAYSHECISGGWWPGTPGSPVDEPAFYAYAYPEPAGCAQAPIRPSGARYDTAMREWILPHADVIKTENPDAVALEFLQATYDIAAKLGSWDESLERPVAIQESFARHR